MVPTKGRCSVKQKVIYFATIGIVAVAAVALVKRLLPSVSDQIGL